MSSSEGGGPQLASASASASLRDSLRSRANSGCLSEKMKVAVSEGVRALARPGAGESREHLADLGPGRALDLAGGVTRHCVGEQCDERAGLLLDVRSVESASGRLRERRGPIGEDVCLVLAKDRREPAPVVHHGALLFEEGLSSGREGLI